MWDSSVDRFSNSVRMHMSSLRRKLRAALGKDPISSRIGEGYVMEEGEGMKALSLRWRLTLMSLALIALVSLALNLLISGSGLFYFDSLGAYVLAVSQEQPEEIRGDFAVELPDDIAAQLNERMPQMVDNSKRSFRFYGWLIAAAVTLAGGVVT